MERFATARLIVRDWTVADAQAAFAIYGRDEVMRWLGARPRSPVASLGEMREMREPIARWQAGAAAAPPPHPDGVMPAARGSLLIERQGQ